MDKMRILIQHLILSAPLCFWLLAAVGLRLSIALNQQDVTYIPLEGQLQLSLDNKTLLWSKLILRKKTPGSDQEHVVVAEWDRSLPGKEKDYEDMTYEGRTELDEETGFIVIRNMTKEDNGVYFMVFDQNLDVQPKLHTVEVIKKVPKPSVVYRPSCSPQSTTCLLVCEGNITDSGPVTYRWKKDEGEWMESGQNWTITNDEEWSKVEKVFCEMKNPVSVKQSDSTDNSFYLKGNTPWRGIIVGIIVLLVILIGLVLGVRYRTTNANASSPRNENEDHINATLPSCGSELVELPEATNADASSSPRNENEVPLLGGRRKEEEESTSDKNNHDSTNDLIDSTIAIATSLCNVCEKVKGNKKQCQRLVERVKGLEELVGEIKQKGAGQKSVDVEEDLRDLNKTLESAEDVVKKYTYDSFHEHVLKDYNDNSEVRSLNLGLNSAFNKLSKALQVDHDHKLHKLFEEASQQAEDEADRKEDHEELKRIMDLIDPILSKTTPLYNFCEEVKGNKKQCQRLAKRVKGLEGLVLTIKQKGAGQNSADVEKDLRDLKLKETLESAKDVVKKYIYDSYHEYVFKDYNDNSEFKSLNHSLNSAFNKLSKALQVDHDHILYKLFNEDSQQEEDEADRKEDHEELKRIMDLIDPIEPIATSFYNVCEEVKGNKKQCQRLVQRVKGGLEELVQTIKQKGAGQISSDVEKYLSDLKETLESAKDVVKKYISDSFHEHAFKDYKDNSEFRSLNGRLNSAFNKLSKALQVDHDHILYKLFNEASQQAEDEADRKKDHEELKRIMDLIDPIMVKATSLSPLCEDAMRNKERRQCLVEHVEVLKECLGAIKEKGPGQKSADVEKALRDLKTTLESDEVTKFVKTYTSDVLCTDYGNDFDSLNKCLGKALNKLSSALPKPK